MSTSDSVDIESVVLKYAKFIFDQDKSKSRISRDNLDFNIKWGKVNFNHCPVEYGENLKPNRPKAHVLFRTVFKNNTDRDQEYSFRTSKVTTSSWDVKVEQAYTRGYEMSVTLKAPGDVFEASAGFHNEMTLTNAEGQSMTEEVTWEVDSQIKVPEHHQTTAKLEVTEDQLKADFAVTTEISGKVFINVTNKRDSSHLTTIEGNIVEILKGNEAAFKLFQFDKKVAKFTTKGRCSFHYAIEQQVTLDHHAI